VKPRSPRRGERAPYGLRAAFILTIAIAYLIIGSLTVVSFILSARGLDSIFAQRYAVTLALLEKNRILSRIDREVALALKLADDPVLQRWAAAEEEPGLKSLALEQLESYRRAFKDGSYFIALDASKHYYIRNTSSANDRVQITTLRPDRPADRWYFDTLAHVDSFALNVDYERLISAAKVWINAVLRDGNGRKIGLCGSGIDITDFLRDVRQTAEKNAATILVDRAGVIEAHPDMRYVLRNASAKEEAQKLTIYDLLGSDADRTRLRTALADAFEGRTEVASLPLVEEGRHYLAAVSVMKDINWFNIVLVDPSGGLRFIDFLPLAATIVASLLLVLLAVALTLGRVVVRPISALAAASREIAAGRYGRELPVVRRDEIGQLTRAFNVMSATIRDTTSGLEQRVQERTSALSEANRALEESQQRIMESLAYARRVQAGILPGQEMLQRLIPRHLVLYAPRDVVGGDFYLVRSFPGRLVAAVIDCMGHGVPGAFITMTVHAVLSHILDAVCNDDPARILDELDRALRETLHRADSDRRLDSGLDIALCTCASGRSTGLFAGAGLSLFVANGGNLVEVKGESRRVGYRSPGSGSAWTNRTMALSAQTSLYLTTDGFLDQAGGGKGFGFGRQRFLAMLESHAALPMSDQESAMRRALDAWKGERPQRDDITVLGFTMKGGTAE
jgi:sigma-B regulation protein RsbU (phosphoserine phosphatase)